jgi:hypothetical protein
MTTSSVTESLFFPVYARYWANIDGVALDLLLWSAVRIVAFRFTVVGEAKGPRDVINTETATDALILIHPRRFSHGILLKGRVT